LILSSIVISEILPNYDSESELMKRRTVGGSALVIAGGFFGRETLIWVYNKILDVASSTLKDDVTFMALSWQDGVAAVLIAFGLILVVWQNPKSDAPRRNNHLILANDAAQIIKREVINEMV
jgi:hypothetical protein